MYSSSVHDEIEKYSQYIKCDKLVELGKEFEKAGKSGGNMFALQLRDLSLTHKWNVNTCVLSEMMDYKSDINDRFWDDSYGVLLDVIRDFPEVELDDLEKAKRVIKFIEKIDKLGISLPEYDASFMIDGIKKEFSLD
ncbi:hypothetical protein EZY14_007480 [Kordia sp. TARA_039_SRF]|nr:hypothetical protein EZY14_007480 [Kordia sp. TARA_039_SRF]